MKVPFSYLPRQFSDPEPLLEALRPVVQAGDFTLGPRVEAFESRFAELHTAPGRDQPWAVGVGSGTDALALALEALGIGPGDEVITSPSTFVATAGAIVMVGARPVFVDTDDRYLMDLEQVEGAITKATRAIMPVHYTGDMVDMRTLRGIADRHGLLIVEDACQAVLASFDGDPPGTWSHAAAFSLHPLKNLHVWGDGGVVLTGDPAVAEAIRLQRNHGLVNRDEVAVFGRNSRLHTLQAVVGSLLMEGADQDTNARIAVARRYDEALAHLAPMVQVPPRDSRTRHVYHLYVLQVDRRDDLLAFLNNRGVEAKVHYPIPVHLQKAAEGLGYQRGDFPRAEAYAEQALTLPANPYLREEEIAHVIHTLEEAVEHFAASRTSPTVNL
ncbi:MAG: DegT/DnrJ/EryC1/StrS family aminotransferase [Deltaproteobacteria bacterium]|nr:DegT/DnrJ/EryC1/StrS family aminotransferase [Deltaproteobacteria bacterium]